MSSDKGRYELWDTETANCVGAYNSEADALRDVARTAEMYGQRSPEVLSLALIRLDVPENEGHIASGAALVDRALSHLTHA